MINNWNAFGLKSTETLSVKVTNAYVEDRYSFVIGQVNPFPEYPLYSLDFGCFARFCMYASFIGMAYCLINHLKQAETEKIKSTYAEFHNLTQNVEAELMSLAADIDWDKKAQGPQGPDEGLWNVLKEKKNHLLNLSWQIFFNAGLNLCKENNLAHQALRDFWLAGKHFILS